MGFPCKLCHYVAWWEGINFFLLTLLTFFFSTTHQPNLRYRPIAKKRMYHFFMLLPRKKRAESATVSLTWRLNSREFNFHILYVIAQRAEARRRQNRGTLRIINSDLGFCELFFALFPSSTPCALAVMKLFALSVIKATFRGKSFVLVGGRDF